MPPKGIITHVLVCTLITGIFGIITLRTCVSLTKQKLVAEIRAVRWTDRLIWSDASHLPTNDVMPIPPLSWNDGMRNDIGCSIDANEPDFILYWNVSSL